MTFSYAAAAAAASVVSSQMLVRIKAHVIDLHPEAVVIEAGAADLTRGVPLTSRR